MPTSTSTRAPRSTRWRIGSTSPTPSRRAARSWSTASRSPATPRPRTRSSGARSKCRSRSPTRRRRSRSPSSGSTSSAISRTCGSRPSRRASPTRSTSTSTCRRQYRLLPGRRRLRQLILGVRQLPAAKHQSLRRRRVGGVQRRDRLPLRELQRHLHRAVVPRHAARGQHAGLRQQALSLLLRPEQGRLPLNSGYPLAELGLASSDRYRSRT